MKDKKIPPGIKWRLAFTIYGSIGTIIGLISFFAFFPTNLNIWQSIAVVAISILVLGAVMATIWIPWRATHMEEIKEWIRMFEDFDDYFDDDDDDDDDYKKRRPREKK